MSGRPSRRAAATRRAAIIESDDDDEVAETTKKIKEDSEDDFTPEVPTQSSRRQTQSRRKSAAPSSTASAASTPAPRRGRPKKSIASESTEQSELLDPDQSTATVVPPESSRRGRAKKSIAPEPAEQSEVLDPDQSTATVVRPESPTKTSTVRKRKSVAPRKSRASVDASKESTPETQANSSRVHTPAGSEEPSELAGSPLADITHQSVNEQRSPAADENITQVKPIKAMDTILEKPMDIVLKSRQMPPPVVEETGPKPRIVITYLILNNFKSYAGRQEVGPFHSSFSSVVGPNGSGKSNVIDSLLFVFGFRASKMRQGKISALIHNSAAHPNLDHCEVAVHFQEVIDLVCHNLLLLTLALGMLTRL
ncbi:RecF/RecN/SMC N terminal domain-containing protein [Biscogniauxia marginata]|nr:RecF/RecN/SMC N terminal domain-containing protein [Biscogniauxia marginata]